MIRLHSVPFLLLSWLGLAAAKMPTHSMDNGDKLPLVGLGVSEISNEKICWWVVATLLNL